MICLGDTWHHPWTPAQLVGSPVAVSWQEEDDDDDDDDDEPPIPPPAAVALGELLLQSLCFSALVLCCHKDTDTWNGEQTIHESMNMKTWYAGIWSHDLD